MNLLYIDYYPYGTPMQSSTGAEVNRYKYGGKEFETEGGLNQYDFEARTHLPQLGLLTSLDPMAHDFRWHSPYLYGAGNPINMIDKDGKREWPVKKKFNGGVRRHENNFGAQRANGTRLHQGVDINIGSGAQDLGAPVMATHDGIIEKISQVGDGDTGGNRVRIKSEDGRVSTSYMHLNEIESSLQVGDFVKEGQQLGTIGNTGAPPSNPFSPHLHYEIELDGNKINPAINKQHLVDPQKLIVPNNNVYSGGSLPPVTVNGNNGIIPKQIEVLHKDLDPELIIN